MQALFDLISHKVAVLMHIMQLTIEQLFRVKMFRKSIHMAQGTLSKKYMRDGKQHLLAQVQLRSDKGGMGSSCMGWEEA